jgi:hypothetical protein
MPETILDKRLFYPCRSWHSFWFLFSIVYIILFPSMIFVVFGGSWFLAILFTVAVLVYIAISSLCAKNFRRNEVQGIPQYIALLFFIISFLGFGFYLIYPYENSIIGVFESALLFGLSSLAIFVSAFIMGLRGQRVHLRSRIGLDDNFIGRQKELWTQQLQGFPNASNIIKELDSGKRIASLFDRGSFDLAILWSCSVMEGVINATIKEICKRDSDKRRLFRTPEGIPMSPHNKLAVFNYTHKYRPCRKKEEITTKTLWKELRNPIAHDTKAISFEETYGALMIFVSFLEEFPKTLIAWQKMNGQLNPIPVYLDHV